MHDPRTVAFEIPRPWPQRTREGIERQLYGRWHWPTLITVWHVDPERDGSDDSCDWHNRKRPLKPWEKGIVEAMWDLETLLDNRPHWPDSPEHKAFQVLKSAVWEWRRRHGWRWHPRWHVWHWSLQVHPLQALKRRLFTRCTKCGQPFRNNESVFSGSWESDGPRWFRSERNVFHDRCWPSPPGATGGPQQEQETK